MFSDFHHTRLLITDEILFNTISPEIVHCALHALIFGTDFRNYYRDIIREHYEQIIMCYDRVESDNLRVTLAEVIDDFIPATVIYGRL